MKRLFSGILALVLILSISAVALGAPDRLPGEGKDGEVNGQGHDWAEGTKKNQNDNKLIEKFLEKGNPGYRNHFPGEGGGVVIL